MVPREESQEHGGENRQCGWECKWGKSLRMLDMKNCTEWNKNSSKSVTRLKQPEKTVSGVEDKDGNTAI